MFGFPRLAQTMADAPTGASLIQHVLDVLEAFTGSDREQEDDITMVSLERAAEGAAEGRGPGLVAEVVAVDGTVDVPSGDYTDVVVIDTRDTLSGRVERSYYAAGVGLVHQETTAGDPAVVLDLVAPPS